MLEKLERSIDQNVLLEVIRNLSSLDTECSLASFCSWLLCFYVVMTYGILCELFRFYTVQAFEDVSF